MSELLCDGCGQPLGAPHTPLDTDCVLPHTDPHVEAKHGHLCPRHFGWILDMLREIEQLWALRGHVLLPGPAGDTRHGTRVGSPAPGNVAVMALTDRRQNAHDIPMTRYLNDDGHGGLESNGADVPDVPGVLLGWYRVVAEEMPIRAVPERITVVGLLHALHRQRRWIARQPWVDDYANELHDLHRALAAATRAGMWPKSIGSCPNCARPLHVTPGVDGVTCRHCKSTWEGPAYARLRWILDRQRPQEAEREQTR